MQTDHHQHFRFTGRSCPDEAVNSLVGSLSYFAMHRSANLPLNLTQAQRDFFGSHTHQRADKPGSGPVHTEWEALLQCQ